MGTPLLLRKGGLGLITVARNREIIVMPFARIFRRLEYQYQYRVSLQR
jgi:hypothetical protein